MEGVTACFKATDVADRGHAKTIAEVVGPKRYDEASGVVAVRADTFDNRNQVRGRGRELALKGASAVSAGTGGCMLRIYHRIRANILRAPESLIVCAEGVSGYKNI